MEDIANTQLAEVEAGHIRAVEALKEIALLLGNSIQQLQIQLFIPLDRLVFETPPCSPDRPSRQLAEREDAPGRRAPRHCKTLRDRCPHARRADHGGDGEQGRIPVGARKRYNYKDKMPAGLAEAIEAEVRRRLSSGIFTNATST